MSPAQVALAWLLSKPEVTAPIAGVTKLPQLEDTIRAVELCLTSDDIERLEGPYLPHLVGGFT